MGEYAIRKFDNQRIKIGTCASMYYLRYEDRNKVRDEDAPKDTLNLYWRLPFPDEDHLRPGEYQDYCRGIRLYRQGKPDHMGRTFGVEDYANPALADHHGTIQLAHESGLLVNVNCHHGEKLPASGEGVDVHWNGKSHSYELSSIKNTAEGVFPVIRCRHCNTKWRMDWADIWDYIPEDMRVRLERYYQKKEAA